MKLWLIRHGMTKGNQEHRYVGTTDEGLLPEEKERLQAKAANMDLHPAIIFVSPARRCMETAMCLFSELRGTVESEYAANTGGAVAATAITAQDPLGLQRIAGNASGNEVGRKRAGAGATRLIVVPEFMEMNFGVFEYKTYQEINADPDPAHRAAYQRYIDSNGEAAFPDGESKAAFTKRVCEGFERAVRPRTQALMKAAHASAVGETKLGTEPEIVFKLQDHRSAEDARLECSGEDIVIVAHGGTIMALMERYAEPHKSYFEWSVKPGEGYRLDITYRS